MTLSRGTAADVTVGMTCLNCGSPCRLAASNLRHGCLSLTGSTNGQTGDLEFSCCDCCVQFGCGHGVGCVFFDIIADRGRGCDPSGKTHPTEERDGSSLLLQIPIEVLSEDSLSVNPEGREESIETGLCGLALVTPIPQLHPGVPDGADFVPVEVDRGGVLLCIEDHGSIGRRPVGVVLNCCGHLLLNLTHGWVRCFDSYKIPQEEGEE